MKRAQRCLGHLALLAIAAASLYACSSSSASLGDGDGNNGGGAGDDGGQTIGDDSGTTSGDSGSGGTLDSGGGGDTDSGVDSGIPSCAGLAYCDDFESYGDGGTFTVANAETVGPWKATVSGGAVMTVDGTKPYSGKQALHITVPNANAGAQGILHQQKAGGLVTGNDVFGRAMVFYVKGGGSDLPKGVHSWVFQAAGNSTASGGNVTMNVANNGTNYFLNYHPHTGSEQSKTGGTPEAGAWLCMQWEYNGSGTTPADEGKIWINGTMVVDATKAAQNWDFATPWDNFDFGFTHYQTTANSIDVYLDDFALNGSMIPCP